MRDEPVRPIGPATEISSQHIAIMQEIVDFLQGKGWDITNLTVQRYNDADEMGMPDEAWRAPLYKWYVTISTAPRDQETLPVRVREEK